MAKAPIIKAKFSGSEGAAAYLDISIAVVKDISSLKSGVMALEPVDDSTMMSLSAVSHCQIIHQIGLKYLSE
jgi:hypothetical protein